MILKMVSDPGYSAGNNAPYANWHGQAMPVKVIAEYPNYFVVEVQPHLNTNRCAFGESNKYTVTLDKWDLRNGVFVWKEKA